jgi:NADH-quinone oxidoreductase subunit C
MFSFNDLKTSLPDLTFETLDVNGTIGAIFERERIRDISRILKEEFGFTHFIDMLGADSNERKMRFSVIYNLRNPQTKERIFLKIRCDERDAHVPSVVSIWSGANWHEREAYDMYGIVFDGHPDMRRMFMPDDFDYYPLRKDFPLMGIEGSTPLPKGSEMATRLN